MLLVWKIDFNFVSCVQVFRARTIPDAITLVSRLLEYTPSARITPLQACAHPFFDELRNVNQRLPNGRELPPLFNFTEQGECVVLLDENVPNYNVACFVFLYTHRTSNTEQSERQPNAAHADQRRGTGNAHWLRIRRWRQRCWHDQLIESCRQCECRRPRYIQWHYFFHNRICFKW